MPPLEPGPLLVVLDLAGIFVFAISGALVALRKELDVFGVLVLTGTTGLGGMCLAWRPGDLAPLARPDDRGSGPRAGHS